jgi:hypothetical protein
MTADRRDRQNIPESLADEQTQQKLAQARMRTRASLARKLKVSKEAVSRIEKRADLYLSTLRSYVEGVGGELTLMVKFPDRPPVILAGLGENAREGKKQAKKRAKTTPKSKAGTRRAA